MKYYSSYSLSLFLLLFNLNTAFAAYRVEEITYGKHAINVGLGIAGQVLQWGTAVLMGGLTTYAVQKTIEKIDTNIDAVGYSTKVKNACVPKEKVSFLPQGLFALWKKCIRRRKEKPLRWMDLFNKEEEDKQWDVGYKPVPGFVLYGPPGTGKTTAAKELARKLRVPFIQFSGADFSTEVFVGSAQKPVRNAIRDLNKFVEKNGDCVCLIDEADSMGSREDNLNHHNYNVINMFLEAIPQNLSSKVRLVLATNYLDRIDPGLFRAGRLSAQRLSYPKKADRLKALLLHAKTRKFYVSAYNHLGEVARKAKYFTYAELEHLINLCAFYAENDIVQLKGFEDYMNNRADNEKVRDDAEGYAIPRAITQYHLDAVLKEGIRMKEMTMRNQLLMRKKVESQLGETTDTLIKKAVGDDVAELTRGVEKVSAMVERLNKEHDDVDNTNSGFDADPRVAWVASMQKLLRCMHVNNTEAVIGKPSIIQKPWYKKLLYLSYSTLTSKKAIATYAGLSASAILYLKYIGFWSRSFLVTHPQ